MNNPQSAIRNPQFNVSRIVSGLMAGIIFVDWLAVAPGCPNGLSAAFLFLFIATLALQRFVGDT